MNRGLHCGGRSGPKYHVSIFWGDATYRKPQLGWPYLVKKAHKCTTKLKTEMARIEV